MYAWNDKGNQQHVEAAEDDVDEQDRHAYGLFQALPLTGSDPDGPTDAEVYLQQVRHEASRLPFVVTSSSKGIVQDNTPVVDHNIHQHSPTDPTLLPSPEWIATFLAQFDALRTSIIQHAEPNTPTSVSTLLQNARVDGTDTPPTTELLQGLDQLGTIRLLKQRIDAVIPRSSSIPATATETTPGLSSLDAQWLFGLLARLELPIDSNTAAMLRKLQQYLQQVRRTQVRGVDDPVLAPVNVLLVAIGARFGQDETLAPLYGS